MAELINTAESSEPTGKIQIADEVIAQIAISATLEADGVAGMARHFTGDLAGRISRKKPAKGCTLRVENGKVRISVEIAVNGGVKIQKVAHDVQQKIKTAIETMTGLSVEEVHVHITGLVA